MRFSTLLAVAAAFGAVLHLLDARAETRVVSDANAIGAVATSRFGPEAGVWVAETTEVGTRHAKIVVTDDFGRYVIPDLRRPPIRARSS